MVISFLYLSRFFNPVVNVSFVEAKYLSNSPAACTCIVCFYCLLSDLFRILSCLRVKCVVFFAVIAKAPLCSRTIFPCIYLTFRFSAERTLPSYYFFRFSHILILPYYALFVQTFFITICRKCNFKKFEFYNDSDYLTKTMRDMHFRHSTCFVIKLT